MSIQLRVAEALSGHKSLHSAEDTGRSYGFEYARLPGRPALIAAVDQAAQRLARKLAALPLDALPISPYIRRHLRLKIDSLDAYLQLYSFILLSSLADTDTPLEQLTLCDYGAGSGVLAMLAKELGVGKVIYNDIYDLACRDAGTVGRALNCEADAYIHGDIAELARSTRAAGAQISAIVSYDVIEHVYDVVDFHRQLADVASESVVMASGANPFNLAIRRNLTRQHHQFEYSDRPAREGHKDRDTLRSHLAVRRDIIREMGVSLTEQDTETLARGTRGLNRDDIVRAVRAFQYFGTLPVPRHPTNTCDPYTGNWQEQLINPFRLAQALASGGCHSRVVAGYYCCTSPSSVRRLAKRCANLAIRVTGAGGLLLSPFYMVCGRKPGARRG
jgi:2-polyprenyl-3-methyl-5-hydroxy-6-metoxy-1,4-benzoquinol methylase